MHEQFGRTPLTYAYWILLGAYTLWLLVDAARRKVPSYWYFIILFMPLGTWAYIFFVMLRDPNLSKRVKSSSTETPSLMSGPSAPDSSDEPPNLDRADKLEEAERYSDAEPLYRRALEIDATNRQALHGLGRCLLGMGRARESVDYLEKLLGLDREYRGYGAALDFADALWEAGQKSDTIDLLDQLANLTGRLNHRLALGYYLSEFGQTERARREITRAIEDASATGDSANPQTQQWIERANEMLQSLDRNSPE